MKSKVLTVSSVTYQVHLEKRPLADDINEESLGRLAFQTQQFVGASLANLVNIAALNAGGAGRDSICYADLQQARFSNLVPPLSLSLLPGLSLLLLNDDAIQYTATFCLMLSGLCRPLEAASAMLTSSRYSPLTSFLLLHPCPFLLLLCS